MSVDRCIEALTVLDQDLGRIGADSETLGWKPTTLQQKQLGILVRELILNIDLRKTIGSRDLMSVVEKDVYLPAIEGILGLLAEDGVITPFSESAQVDAAQGIARRALREANLRRV